jgi:insulysin
MSYDRLESMSDIDNAPFDRPCTDSYLYRHVVLDNSLECLLVSDPSAEKSAASCDVRVGSLSDPENVPGLAHFLEHMLFYSSEKFQEEDAYSKFISEHGGKTNAYTSNESTNFHFDVNSDHLKEALDRFAQFFICPTISEDGVLREARAVDSEHQKNMNTDFWKQLQLWKSYSLGRMNRFSTGNYETLIGAQDGKGHSNVVDFYKQHYSSNLMKLVVIGRESLDELEKMCTEMFQLVPNNHLSPLDEAIQLGDDHRGIMIKHVPEKEGHTVEIQWLTSISEEQCYRKSPLGTISHILGHEAKGTLFSVLKHEGWATALTAGEASTSTSKSSFFSVRIELTDSGFKNVNKAISLVFSYIHLIRDVFLNSQESAQALWAENLQLSNLRFQYAEKMDPFRFASNLSHAMQLYKLDDLLKAMYHVPFEYDPDLALQVIDDLTPENARIIIASKTVENDCSLVEPWYGTKYTEEAIPGTLMSKWKNDCEAIIDEYHLCIPDKNSYIPVDLSLAEESMDLPEIVSESKTHTLYFRSDSNFKTPKAVMYFQFRLAESYVSPTAATMTNIIVKLVNDRLNEESYSAQLAGLHYELSTNTEGILLQVAGYHDKMNVMITLVIDTLLSVTEIEEERFTFVKHKLKKEFSNLKFEQPYRLALYEMDVGLEFPKWHMRDYESILDSIDHSKVNEFVISRLLSHCHISALCEGNMSKEKAVRIITHMETQIQQRFLTSSLPSSQLIRPRIVCIKPGHNHIYKMQATETENPNSAIVVSIQAPASKHANVMFELLAHTYKRDAFYQLRTVEQLGYIVFFSSYAVRTVYHLLILIQSSEYSTEYLEQRAMSFLSTLENKLTTMTKEEFETSVGELIASKQEKPKRLTQKAARHWAEIESGTLRFDRTEAEIQVLQELSQAEFTKVMLHQVCKERTRQMLRVHIQSSKSPIDEEGDSKGLISDIFAWKSNQVLYPSSIDNL